MCASFSLFWFRSSDGALNGNDDMKHLKKTKIWSKIHTAIFNNMLMVEANERKNKRAAAVVVVTLTQRIYEFRKWANLSSFRFTKPSKSNFIWPISQFQCEYLLNQRHFCAKLIWSCCYVFFAVSCVFSVWVVHPFRIHVPWCLRLVDFFKLKKSEFAVFRLPLKLVIGMYRDGAWYTDSLWFWPTQPISIIFVSWRIIYGRSEKKDDKRIGR